MLIQSGGKMVDRVPRRSLFGPGVVIGAILFGVALFGLTIGVFIYFRPEPVPAAASTAVLNIIHAPTATVPPPTPTPTLPATPTVPVPPSPEEGTLGVGAFVQISGTGGDGLRIRSEAGLQGTVQALGIEAEVFEITAGPQEADGYTWWYLTAPYEEARAGWAVANYLQPIQNP
jgi:hypothetical protein